MLFKKISSVKLYDFYMVFLEGLGGGLGRKPRFDSRIDPNSLKLI